MRRRRGRAVVLCVAAAALAGCGPGNGQAVNTGLRVTADVMHFSADSHVVNTSFESATHALGSAIEAGADAHNELSQIAKSDDQLGTALTNAFCTGAGQLADEGQDATATPQNWNAFLVQEI